MGRQLNRSTVQIATREMDAGPILAQEVVPVLRADTEATLHERIKQVERVLYPAVIGRALAELDAGRAIVPEGMTTESSGQRA